MKNGEQPINPISEDEKDRLDQYPEISFKGLTKREHFTAMAMQGLLSNSSLRDLSASEISNLSIDQADSILKALEQ